MVNHYVFWLALVSILCLLLERLFPWRRHQKLLRPQFLQDLFWLVFIGYIAGIIFSGAYTFINSSIESAFSLLLGVRPSTFKFISAYPFGLQCLIFLLIADFLEWCVHNLLHRTNWLWKIHRVHHSILTMDWIGNFRMHWGELFIYHTLKYLPLSFLGTRPEVILTVSVFSTLIGHLNHANLNISWGPFRYIFNSPRMHIWHHEKEIRGKAGVNFAIVFSIWDWLFKTAYMPKESLSPEKIGFKNQEKVPDSLLMRFFLPFVDAK